MAIDPNTAKVQSVGNPDFWQTGYAVNPAAYIAIQALSELWEPLRQKEVDGEVPVAIGRMMDVSFKSLHAVVNLTLNGFGSDAVRIARSMWEYEITSSYLRLHPELVTDYNDFIYVCMAEEYDFLLEKGPDLLTNRSPEIAAQIQAALKAAERFRRKGRLPNSWKDVSIKKMAEETGRADVYRTVYRWGSGHVHGDITSIFAVFDVGNGHVDVGPSVKGIDLALRTAHHAQLSLMMDFNEEGQRGFDTDLEIAKNTFLQAWTPLP